MLTAIWLSCRTLLYGTANVGDMYVCPFTADICMLAHVESQCYAVFAYSQAASHYNTSAGDAQPISYSSTSSKATLLNASCLLDRVSVTPMTLRPLTVPSAMKDTVIGKKESRSCQHHRPQTMLSVHDMHVFPVC